LPVFSIGQNKDFRLTGKITDPVNKMIYLQYTGKNGKIIKDSCLIKEGIFPFSGNIAEPAMAILKGNLKFMDDSENPNITDFTLNQAI